MHHRPANLADLHTLAGLNRQLAEDENLPAHHPLTTFANRLRRWLTDGGYHAHLFFDSPSGETLAYALYRILDDPDSPTVHLRHFFVARGHRRQGVGSACIATLRHEVWPADHRVTVSALTRNTPAVTFWRHVGFSDLCLTLEAPPTSTP